MHQQVQHTDDRTLPGALCVYQIRTLSSTKRRECVDPQMSSDGMADVWLEVFASSRTIDSWFVEDILLSGESWHAKGAQTRDVGRKQE